MASSASSPHYGLEALSSPRLMLAKGPFGVVRTKRKLQRETPPRLPHPVSEASFESSHLPKIPLPKGKKGPREAGDRMILKHLQLDSSVFANSSSESESISSKSEEEDKVQELLRPPPKDFLEELIQKYSGQGQMNFAEVVKAKGQKPVRVFWEKKHGLGYIPSAREGATLTPVNRRLYLFGGESRSLFNDIMILNPETWKWESASLSPASDPVPEARSGHSTVNYKNSLIVFGGGGAFNPMLKIRKCFNRVHVFDTISNMWTTPAPFGNVPAVRRNHAAALVGTTMVMYGGMDELGNPLDDLLALNMETMRWFTPRIHRSCTVRPGKRHSLCMVPVYNYGVLKQFNFDIFHVPTIHDDTISRNNSGLYMFGGITKSGKASNDLFVLKPKKIDYKDDDYYLKWTQPEVTGLPPEPRYSYCAALRGKYIAFFGGRNDEMHAGGLAVRDIALLNVEIMRWETVLGQGMSPAGRWGACMAAFHTKMVVFGGMRINKYCSGKIVIAETDPQVVKEQEAELKYIQNVRETMGRNAFERINRAALVGIRSIRSHRETTCSLVALPPIGRHSEEGVGSN